MPDKSPLLAIYALVGILVAAWPVAALFANWRPRPANVIATDAASRIAVSSVVFGAMVVFVWAFGPAYGVASAVYLAYLAYVPLGKALDVRSVLGAAFGLAIASTLPWWRHAEQTTTIVNLTWGEALFYVGVLIFVHRVLTRAAAPREIARRFTIARHILVAVAVVLIAFLSFATGIYEHGVAINTTWHHWGAYIAPSELLLSDARIFLDFPAQYGLGPTLLIAASCGNDCWSGMYFIVGGSVFAFAVTLGAVAWRSAPRAATDLPMMLVLVAAVVLCGLFWNSFPPQLATPAATPSTNGLRYLPVLALAALLVWRYADGGQQRYGLAHGTWALCALWSPESAFMATLLWWPYYVWLRTSQAGPVDRVRSVLAALLTLLGVAAATVAAFLAAYGASYHTLPSLHGYLAYLLHPPGVLPITPWGPVWFLVAALGLGAMTVFRLPCDATERAAFNERFILLLLAYSAASYFLGRSHDNNVLNLLAFLLPLMLSSLRAGLPAAAGSALVVMVASLLGWAGVFGGQLWHQAQQADRMIEVVPERLRGALSWANQDTTDKIRAEYSSTFGPFGDLRDAARAIDEITSTYHEPVTVENGTYNLTPSAPGDVWCGRHGPANYGYLPAELRREFVRRTAAALKRPGWMVVDRSFANSDVVRDMESAYTITRLLDFGSYYALRYVPIVTTAPAAEHGPSPR